MSDSISVDSQSPFLLSHPLASPLTHSLLAELENGRGTLSQREQANVCERLSDSFYADGDLDECIEYLARGLKIFEFYKDSKACARLSNKLGCTHTLKQNYSLALENFNNAVAHCQDVNDYARSTAMAHVNVASLQLALGRIKDAQTTIEESLSLLMGMDDLDGLQDEEKEAYSRVGSAVHAVKGLTLALVGDYEGAKRAHSTDLDLATAAGSEAGILRARTNLGVCCAITDDVPQALSHFGAADEAIVDRSGYDVCRNWYSLALCHVNLLRKGGASSASAEAIVVLDRALAVINDNVRQLTEEARAKELEMMEVERMKGVLDDGTGNAVDAVEEEKKDAPADGDPSSAEGEEEEQKRPPRAFNTTAGGLLHAQVLNLRALANLYRETPAGLSNPDIEAAISSVEEAFAVTTQDMGLLRGVINNTYGIISAVGGDIESMKRHHGMYSKCVEGDESYKSFRDVQDGEESLEPFLGIIAEGSTYGTTDKQGSEAGNDPAVTLNKKRMKLKASRNLNLSTRNGVGMGLAFESGLGSLAAPALRSVMDLHKKEILAADRLNDVTASVVAKASLGCTAGILGGRKADAFDNLEVALKHSMSEGDLKMQAGVLRTLAELQAASGEHKNSAGTLKKYLKAATELNDLLSMLDCLKKLMGAYVCISETRKEMDSEAVLDQESHDAKTEEELDELEKDDQFLRGNAKLRAMRFGKRLKELGNYWQWANVTVQSKCEEEEEAHMKTLTSAQAVPAIKKGGDGGAAAAFGGAFGGGAKKSFGTVFG